MLRDDTARAPAHARAHRPPSWERDPTSTHRNACRAAASAPASSWTKEMLAFSAVKSFSASVAAAMNSSRLLASVTLCSGLLLCARSAMWKPVLQGERGGGGKGRTV
jgi:hypothetical protein